MRSKYSVIALFCRLCTTSRRFAQQTPSTSQPNTTEERTQWFRDARFGMYIHSGLYSILAEATNPSKET